MKKTLTILGLALGLGFNSMAQKVDLDRLGYNLSVKNFPLMAQDSTFKTFSVEYPKGNGVSADFGIDFSGSENTMITGFRKLDTRGHLNIKYSFIDARIVENNVREIRNEQKNSQGQVTSVTIEYIPTFKYTIKLKAEIKDYKGNLLKTENFEVVGKTVDAGQEKFREYNKAQQYLYNNRRSIFTTTFTNEYNNFVNLVNSSLAANFGWNNTKLAANIWELDSKKHPEFDKHSQITAEFVSWASGIFADIDLTTEQKAKAQEFLTYFESLKGKYNTEEKPDKKMRYDAFYTKGIIYLFFLHDFDKAIVEGNGLIANDYDKGDGTWIIETANKYKALFKQTKRNSMRFSINLENAQGPQ